MARPQPFSLPWEDLQFCDHRFRLSWSFGPREGPPCSPEDDVSINVINIIPVGLQLISLGRFP